MAKFDAARLPRAGRAAPRHAHDAGAGAVPAPDGVARASTAHDLSSFQFKFCTSAPFRAALKADVLQRWPGGLVEFYGMTEGGGTCILRRAPAPEQAAHRGPARRGPRHPPDRRARPRAAAPATRSARWSAARPAMMTGYHNQPAKTARGRVVRRRGQALHPHRRRRPLRRRRLPDADRPQEGHDHLAAASTSTRATSRPCCASIPAVADVAVVGVPSERVGRDAGGLRRARAPARSDRRPTRSRAGPTSASARRSGWPTCASSTSCRAARSARCSSANCATRIGRERAGSREPF